MFLLVLWERAIVFNKTLKAINSIEYEGLTFFQPDFEGSGFWMVFQEAEEPNDILSSFVYTGKTEGYNFQIVHYSFDE